MLYERSLKFLSMLVIMWMVSMLTIVTHYRTVPDKYVMTPLMKYESNLRKLHKIEANGSDNDYEIWRMMTPKFAEISIEDKYSVVKGRDFPPGMNGRPVYLIHDIKNPLRAIVRKGWVDHAFNEFISSIIPLNRTLPDVRDPWCKLQNYSETLPQVSVVICFHNEAWSALLRTIHSVLNRSPPHLLKEIILFDDHSNLDELNEPLNDYVKTVDKLILIRASRREGLIRSRILAMKFVTAPVVVFLDSHCECTEGWLEPLLDPISKDATKVVSPVVDAIHDNSFEYIHQEVNDLRIGGFTWDLRFVWQSIPRETLQKRPHPAAPIKTPTISGGLFAINKKYFQKLGYYDSGFEFWGAENLELSFKTWMCGGSMEIIPCSHVGHVFRKRFPYKKDVGATKRNCVRLAEVWLDDYAKYFYQRIGYDKGEFGDVTKEKFLRETLQCKSFEWYLKEISPEMVIPEDYVASGKIYGLSGDLLCFDASTRVEDIYQETLALLPCHFKGGNQFWIYTKEGEIRKDDFCLEDLFNNVFLNFCTGRQLSQIWVYNNNTQTIMNMQSMKCLKAVQTRRGWKAILEKCSLGHRLTWKMENYNVTRLAPELQVYAKRYVI